MTVPHMNNNEAKAARRQPGYDLFVIQNWPVIDTPITQFQDIYRPEEQLTIDKVICPF
jgi:hypothetical protein